MNYYRQLFDHTVRVAHLARCEERAAEEGPQRHEGGGPRLYEEGGSRQHERGVRPKGGRSECQHRIMDQMR